jgi:hypothetical protein
MRVMSLAVLLFIAMPSVHAGTPEPIAPAGYAQALQVADQFLWAWVTGDSELGLRLISTPLLSHVRLDPARGDVWFLQYMEGLSNPHHTAFEISAGIVRTPARVAFDVALFEYYDGEPTARRYDSKIELVREPAGAAIPESPLELGASSNGGSRRSRLTDRPEWKVDVLPTTARDPRSDDPTHKAPILRVEWVRSAEAELAADPDGRTIAALARSTAVEAGMIFGDWREVTVSAWIRTECLDSVASRPSPGVCRVREEGELLDAPWAGTWGGTTEQSGTEEFGTGMGRVAKGATVTCLGSELSTTQLFLRGWIRRQALTDSPDSIDVPASCASVTVVAAGDSTRFHGIVIWDSPHAVWRFYRLILYDHSGARLFVKPFDLHVTDASSAARDGVPFDVGVPVPRQSIATYRVARPGSGIIAAYK